MEGWRERREGERGKGDSWREGERGREEGEGGREGGRQGGRQGGREGGREGGRVGNKMIEGREGFVPLHQEQVRRE